MGCYKAAQRSKCHDTVHARRLTDRASAAGATVLGAPSGCLLHRSLLGAQIERCRGARQLQAHVRPPHRYRDRAPLQSSTARSIFPPSVSASARDRVNSHTASSSPHTRFTTTGPPGGNGPGYHFQSTVTASTVRRLSSTTNAPRGEMILGDWRVKRRWQSPTDTADGSSCCLRESSLSL